MKLIIIIFMTIYTNAVLAEVKVIANVNVEDSELNMEITSNIFLDKMRNLPSGLKVVTLDQQEGSAVRDEFYTKASKKEAAQLKAYWSRLVFTGRGHPPKVTRGDEEVLKQVSANLNTIGYVSGNADTSAVKVLLTLP